MTRTPPALAAIITSVLLVVASACSRASRPAGGSANANSATAAAPAAESLPLPPVKVPDLESVGAAVRQQIDARRDALDRALADGAPATERAARYGELGHVLLASTFFDEAALCYRHAEALQPSDPKWPYFTGQASLRNGNREAAARSFERTLALQPSYLPAMIWLGDTYLDLGRADEAQAIFGRAVAQQPDSAAARFGAGRAAIARRAYAEAVQQLEQALRIDPGASAINYPLAMAYRGMGQGEKAEALLRRRGSVAPELPDPLMEQADVVLASAVSFEGLGMDALRRQDWKGAVDAFRRGLEVAPGDASLRYWLASAMIASGDAAGAEREFREVVRRHPDFAKAHFSLGAIADQRGQKADALREYQAAVRYAPNMPEARLRLADTLRGMGQLRLALDEYQHAVTLDPGVADAWIGGARVLVDLGEREQAREWIARARRLHPNRRELADLDARVR